ncbi:MAG: hypothetical protein ACRENW_04525 [Thermodesulfobacteriota bacterium]
MRKAAAMFVALAMFLSVSLSAGCEGGRIKAEYEKLKAETEQLTKDKADLESKIQELTNQVNTLTTENEQLKSQLAALTQPSPAPEGTPPAEEMPVE